MLAGLAVLVTAAITVAAVAWLVLGASSGSQVAWSGETTVIKPERLPNDRIATGKARNAGDEEISLRSDDVTVVARSGARLPTSAAFLQGFAHGIWPTTLSPTAGSMATNIRLGRVAVLKPGDAAPLTVSWTRRDGEIADHIELGDGETLPLP
ncbi:MAG: hypothetical protein ACR2NA_01250 [Solirubrobacterales bacterium]